jgi:hypothetical protein
MPGRHSTSSRRRTPRRGSRTRRSALRRRSRCRCWRTARSNRRRTGRRACRACGTQPSPAPPLPRTRGRRSTAGRRCRPRLRPSTPWPRTGRRSRRSSVPQPHHLGNNASHSRCRPRTSFDTFPRDTGCPRNTGSPRRTRPRPVSKSGRSRPILRRSPKRRRPNRPPHPRTRSSRPRCCSLPTMKTRPGPNGLRPHHPNHRRSGSHRRSCTR